MGTKKLAPEPSMDDLLDGALGSILNQGWNEAPGQSSEQWKALTPVATPVETVADPTPARGRVDPIPGEYPPLPVRDDVAHYLEPQPHGGALMRSPAQPEDDPDPVAPQRAVMDIGLLADLAAGRKTAAQAAAFAGVSADQVQSSLALALREVPPDEIAKALGLQAAEQQLKSGAIYGVVLADLVADMASGRLKPEVKIELAKLLARVGRVEPKDDKSAGAGNGFVLNISMGAGQQPIIIDAN